MQSRDHPDLPKKKPLLKTPMEERPICRFYKEGKCQKVNICIITIVGIEGKCQKVNMCIITTVGNEIGDWISKNFYKQRFLFNLARCYYANVIHHSKLLVMYYWLFTILFIFFFCRVMIVHLIMRRCKRNQNCANIIWIPIAPKKKIAFLCIISLSDAILHYY